LSSDFKLNQNFPNPFNPKTNIEYDLPDKSIVLLKVYNIRGEEIITLVESEQPPGNHRVIFDGTELNSGVYFCFFTAGRYKDVKKMVFMK
jgi:hypothetical protein